MRSWIIILFGLLASGYFTDVYSDSTMQAIVCPLIFTLLIIISIVKAAITTSFASDRSSADSSGFLGGGGFISGSGSSSGSSDCSGGGGDC